MTLPIGLLCESTAFGATATASSNPDANEVLLDPISTFGATVTWETTSTTTHSGSEHTVVDASFAVER